MSEDVWRGKHNPDRHVPMAPNDAECRWMLGGCRTPCLPERLCFCCMEEDHRAEVEALKARVQEMSQQAYTSVSHALAEERAEKAEAAIQRVRDVCKEYHLDDSYPTTLRLLVFRDRILCALDGPDE